MIITSGCGTGHQAMDANRIKKRCDALLLAMTGRQELVDRWWKGSNKGFDGDTPENVFARDPLEVYLYLIRCAEGEW